MEFYTIEDYENNRFYQLPKFLIENEAYQGLGNDGRILYALLRDRHSLSKANNWVDKNNAVYFLYSREEMSKILHLSLPTVRKAIKQLKQYHLIWEKRRGQGEANLLYLLKPEFTVIYNDKKIQSEKYFQSGKKKYCRLEGKEFSRNNTYNIKTDCINQSIKGEERLIEASTIKEIEQSQTIPYSYQRNYKKMEIAVNYFANTKDYLYTHKESKLETSTYVLAIGCLVEMACSTKIEIYNGSHISYAKIIDNINQCIISEHGLGQFIELVIEDYIKQSTQVEIRNIKKYMKTCLWNGFISYQVKWNTFFERSYYKNVNCDNSQITKKL